MASDKTPEALLAEVTQAAHDHLIPTVHAVGCDRQRIEMGLDVSEKSCPCGAVQHARMKRAMLTRALAVAGKVAHYEQAAACYGIYDSLAHVGDNPKIEPALREERDRLLRELASTTRRCSCPTEAHEDGCFMVERR